MANIRISKRPLRKPEEKDNDPEFLALCGSIKIHALLQPIIVREVNDYYEMIDGTRRLHALKAMGIQKTPVIIVKIMDDKEALIISFNLNACGLIPLRLKRQYL